MTHTDTDPCSGFDIAPFALPNCEPAEIRFEEARDIVRVVVDFTTKTPRRLAVEYLRKTWPESRVENDYAQGPCGFGWSKMDDWFNAKWQRARAIVERTGPRQAAITFRGLTDEFPEQTEYDVNYRRTLGVRIAGTAGTNVCRFRVYTVSPTAETRLRVDLDAGKRTPGVDLGLSGYNAILGDPTEMAGLEIRGDALALRADKSRSFCLGVRHLASPHPYSGDDGHVTFALAKETFTISLSALQQQGPIWYPQTGVYIRYADDPTEFAAYREQIRSTHTVNATVAQRAEQSFAGATYGQPRAHPVAYTFGCKQARQRFWLEANGDLLLHKWNVTCVAGRDTEQFAAKGNLRFAFGLRDWTCLGRSPSPAPVLAYNISARKGDVTLSQHSFAVPLATSIQKRRARGDDTIVAMLRFRLTNTGPRSTIAVLPVALFDESNRHTSSLAPASGKRQPSTLRRDKIFGLWRGKPVLRAAVATTMRPRRGGSDLSFTQRLAPGQSCELILKVPYVALESRDELQALDGLDFDACRDEVFAFWRREGLKGAQLRVPVPQLEDLYRSHPAHVGVTDLAMPDDPYLINTSVGSSTYGNFTNESCMIINDLHHRGLFDEARRRLSVWVRYQSTAELKGNFTEYDGTFFGAGGFESGNTYDQHHGWVLWGLAEHFFFTGDRDWLFKVADALIAGVDWVLRQRRHTMTAVPHSRGWEYGFLPAGSLEDVDDFFYWLSTNTLTWRGVNHAARALASVGHPDAVRLGREANAFRRDLIDGFEKMRAHTPLVRLRDGRWVPNYPSRLYSRGRDYGWIREVLEGSVYLLISGLYKSTGKSAGWILDDYQDNRYMSPPFGYDISLPEQTWFDRGGFSIQPNLLAGPMPHLDRDEPEIYIWMFFNAWAACYREEIGAMVEHPMPVLGYSNTAHYKTSDQANAVHWLHCMFVYEHDDLLHLGRAIPRAWLGSGEEIGLQAAATTFGVVSITYATASAPKQITATLDLGLLRSPGKLLVRFRHPEKKRIRSVRINGKAHARVNPRKGDVDITGLSGKLEVVAAY